MDIEKFITERPYLYHLTSKTNSTHIIEQKLLYSSNELIKLTKDKTKLPMQRQKRLAHCQLIINGISYSLRDQKPISEKALSKCLTDGWNVGDFLFHLNNRVFTWPNLDRLWRHFNRYVSEKPVIFRFPTREIISANPHVEFCRLNSGATRANAYLKGKPPARGSQTFLPAELYNLTVSSVAEVTFENYCNLNFNFSIGSSPEGVFRKA